MKLFAFVSVVALTAATGAFAQAVPPGANSDNCSPGIVADCASTSAGSAKIPAVRQKEEGIDRSQQQSQLPMGDKPVNIQRGSDCPPGQQDCVKAPTGSERANDSANPSRGAPN
jgi:hypothetical protein